MLRPSPNHGTQRLPDDDDDDDDTQHIIALLPFFIVISTDTISAQFWINLDLSGIIILICVTYFRYNIVKVQFNSVNVRYREIFLLRQRSHSWTLTQQMLVDKCQCLR